MTKTKLIFSLILFLSLVFFHACTKQTAIEEETEESTVTPVTLTGISHEAISETIELNAISLLLKKNYLKSPIAGYIENILVSTGDLVKTGQTIFTVRTKESNAIAGNKVVDSLLDFSGVISVRTGKEGRIDSLGHQRGDYVPEGEQVATISENNSLSFLVNVPFESMKYLKKNQVYEIVLPDESRIKAKYYSNLSAADQQSQTIGCLLKPITDRIVAENIIVKVIIPKNVRDNAVVLPVETVLSDETQTEFWVMKMINDSTAVRVAVKPGISQNDKIEIIEPVFSDKDRILMTGQYGLADTAIVKPENK